MMAWIDPTRSVGKASWTTKAITSFCPVVGFISDECQVVQDSIMDDRISSIEPAKPEDLDEILSLVNKTNTEWYESIIPSEYWYEPFLSKEQFEEMATIMNFFIQRDGGAIVSVGSFGIRKDGIAWIPLMTVRTDFQRKGLGFGMLQHLEGLAIEKKHSRVILETDNDAVWVVNFYQKNGYSIFKKEENPWGFHIWMEKTL